MNKGINKMKCGECGSDFTKLETIVGGKNNMKVCRGCLDHISMAGKELRSYFVQFERRNNRYRIVSTMKTKTKRRKAKR